MSASPLFSQRFQGCLYCLIFDFQGSWPAHSRDSHMISASPRTVNKNFALFLFFCPSAEYTIFAVFLRRPSLLLFYRYFVSRCYSDPLFCYLSKFCSAVTAPGILRNSKLSFPFQCFPYSYRIPFPIGPPTLSTLKPLSLLSFLFPLILRCFCPPSFAHISKLFSFPALFFRCLLLYPIATHP